MHDEIRLTHCLDQYDAHIRSLFETFGGNCDEDVMLVDKYRMKREFSAIVMVESARSLPRVLFVNYLPEEHTMIIIKREKLPQFEFLLP